MELDLGEYSPAPPPARRKLSRGPARSLLVTPWFSASAGVVIAAALWINSPYTELRFNSDPAIAPCTGGCGVTGGGHSDLSSPSQKLRNHRPATRDAAADRATRRRAADDVTFTYQIWQYGDRFSEVIMLSGRNLPANWTLQLEIVHTFIRHVMWAHWQQWTSDDGGTASPPGPSQFGPGRHGDEAIFVVRGSGRASRPVNCVFDGNITCSFIPARGGDQGLGGRHHGHGGDGGYRDYGGRWHGDQGRPGWGD